MIARSVATIKMATRHINLLGNLYVARNRGYAQEYVEAMWQILRQCRRAFQVEEWMIRRRLTGEGVKADGAVHFNGTPFVRLVARSRFIIENHFVLCGPWLANTLDARGPCLLQNIQPGAINRIGWETRINSDTIISARSVTIGSRVLVGAGALITDSEHHCVEFTVGGQPRPFDGLPNSKEVDAEEIEEYVFVGAGSIIQKSLRVGNGTVIGAGNVIVCDAPSRVVVAGNLARVVRELRAS